MWRTSTSYQREHGHDGEVNSSTGMVLAIISFVF